ncbi:MAG: FAD-dependent oxidoreductase, partial [Hyphomicrobiales bacterium]|nr:FAD-dependent oxidoreductase [Hyphomicrobiales bacterium]
VMDGKAPESLLETYDYERIHGADENILNSSRSTDFITPKSKVSRTFRNAVLDLSEVSEFARPLVNSGRLSVPCVYDGSPLNGADATGMPARTRPGAPAADAPIDGGWLIDRLGDRFQLLAINTDVPDTLDIDGIAVEALRIAANDTIRDRYLGEATSAVYLMRPDQHVAARWPGYDADAVRAAVMTATGRA